MADGQDEVPHKQTQTVFADSFLFPSMGTEEFFKCLFISSEVKMIKELRKLIDQSGRVSAGFVACVFHCSEQVYSSADTIIAKILEYYSAYLYYYL